LELQAGQQGDLSREHLCQGSELLLADHNAAVRGKAHVPCAQAHLLGPRNQVQFRMRVGGVSRSDSYTRNEGGDHQDQRAHRELVHMILSTDQARSCLTTSPPTSVRRKSRPWKRYVNFVWSRPSRWRTVACRSWTW